MEALHVCSVRATLKSKSDGDLSPFNCWRQSGEVFDVLYILVIISGLTQTSF